MCTFVCELPHYHKIIFVLPNRFLGMFHVEHFRETTKDEV